MLANLIICSHHVLSHFLPCYQSLQRRPLKSKAQWLVFNSQRGDNSQEPPQVHGDPGAQKGKDGERPHRQRWGAGIEKGMSRNMVITLLLGERLKPLVQRGCTAAPLATPCDKNGTSCPKRRLTSWPEVGPFAPSLVRGGGSLPKEWNLLSKEAAAIPWPKEWNLLFKSADRIMELFSIPWSKEWNLLSTEVEPLVQRGNFKDTPFPKGWFLMPTSCLKGWQLEALDQRAGLRRSDAWSLQKSCGSR